MLIANFQTGSISHFITLFVIAILTAGLAVVTKRTTVDANRISLRKLIGWGSLVAGLLNTAYWLSPSRFDLSQSLPLHLCNLANFIGAAAVLKEARLFKGLLYFWSGLCLWAFLTPTTDKGVEDPGFWIFWLYHSFILFTLVVILRGDQFRPTFRDLQKSMTFSVGLVGCLFVINAITGWNYGFLGNDVPGVATPVSLLGSYPLRVLWMTFIGAGVFVVLWLPHRAYSATRTRK